jgi:ligand-binding SRPBCC domain-containing protein
MVHIELQTEIHAPPDRVFDMARDIELHQRSMAHTSERAIGGRMSGRIGLGETVTWSARHLGRRWSLTSRITAFDPPHGFVDEQVAGPFAWFRHEHRFEAVPGGTRMIDDWRHAAPLGLAGRVVDAVILGALLRRLLVARNEVIAREAEAPYEDRASR